MLSLMFYLSVAIAAVGASLLWQQIKELKEFNESLKKKISKWSKKHNGDN